MRAAMRFVAYLALPLALIGCIRQPLACRGLVSAESVAASPPVIAAFRAHLADKSPTTDSGKYLSDYRNYDLAITTSESQFEYEFVPRDNGRGFKGGGAVYSVSRETGKIEDLHFLK